MTLEELEKVEVVKSAAEKLMKTDDDYRKLRSEFHPDRFSFGSTEQNRAEKVFVKLERLWELTARNSVIGKRDRTHKPFPIRPPKRSGEDRPKSLARRPKRAFPAPPPVGA